MNQLELIFLTKPVCHPKMSYFLRLEVYNVIVYKPHGLYHSDRRGLEYDL